MKRIIYVTLFAMCCFITQSVSAQTKPVPFVLVTDGPGSKWVSGVSNLTDQTSIRCEIKRTASDKVTVEVTQYFGSTGETATQLIKLEKFSYGDMKDMVIKVESWQWSTFGISPIQSKLNKTVVSQFKGAPSVTFNYQEGGPNLFEQFVPQLSTLPVILKPFFHDFQK